MGKKAKKVGKNRQDKFYHLAKEQGFRSRASFKLVQLNKRHDFLSTAARGVIDLCAAPGGWMQVARKHMPVGAPCIGIDLVPIRPVSGCIAIQGDITSHDTRSQLKQALRQAGGHDSVDVVLNDGSPNMGKAWLQDAYTQSELTLAALKLASEFLVQGGTFVTKVFRSNDYNSLLYVMNQLFQRVNATKPSASRAESAEIYILCSAFKAPKHIDPRLLNPKHVFKDLTDVPEDDQKPDLILNTVMKNMKATKRNRAGYEDGNLTMFTRVSVLQFCRSTRPVATMVEASQISFDVRDVPQDASKEDASRVIRLLDDMPETTDHVKHCFRDLKVLARRDFKLILKWRSVARQKLQEGGLLEKTLLEDSSRHLTAEKPDSTTKPDTSKMDSDSEQDTDHEKDLTDSDEELLSEEMKKARDERIAKEKRKRRKLNKVRAATQRKIDMKIILPEENLDTDGADPQGLFSLNTASSVLGRVATVDGTPDVAKQDGYEAEVEDANEVRPPYQIMDVEETNNEMIEEDLDRWYKVYLSRKKRDKNGAILETKEKRRLTKRRALREALVQESEKKNNDGEKRLDVNSSESSESEMEEDDGISLPKGAISREAALWFAQPVFDGVTCSSDDERTGANDDPAEGEYERSAEDDTVDATESFHKAALKEAEAMAQDLESKAAGEDFDVVPMAEEAADNVDSASDTESFHSSDYDTDEKAEMVAIAKKMQQSKQVSNDMLDEAYHRYTFDDPVDLPRWFADPDPTYRRRQPPVTKEQVAEMKEYIKSLQTAPTKKEAEAKARRRARAAKKMEAVKAKATSIAEQGDIPASSRMKAIEDLYKQALKSGKGGKKAKRKVYQVVRPNGRMPVGKGIGKGRKGMRGARTTLVDKRMKADKRGLAKAQKRSRNKTR